MRLIIAGGRHHTLTEKNILELNKIQGISSVVSGGAKGIDADGESWAKSHNIPVQHDSCGGRLRHTVGLKHEQKKIKRGHI